MNARFTFTRRNTLLGTTTLAAWSLWACAAITASAILTQSIGPAGHMTTLDRCCRKVRKRSRGAFF
jgi:hypothetical protein